MVIKWREWNKISLIYREPSVYSNEIKKQRVLKI